MPSLRSYTVDSDSAVRKPIHTMPSASLTNILSFQRQTDDEEERCTDNQERQPAEQNTLRRIVLAIGREKRPMIEIVISKQLIAIDFIAVQAKR